MAVDESIILGRYRVSDSRLLSEIGYFVEVSGLHSVCLQEIIAAHKDKDARYNKEGVRSILLYFQTERFDKGKVVLPQKEAVPEALVSFLGNLDCFSLYRGSEHDIMNFRGGYVLTFVSLTERQTAELLNLCSED